MKSGRLKVASTYFRHNKRLFVKQLLNVAVHSLEMRTKPTYSHACPYTIFIEPTIRCNLRCPMCDLDARGRGSPDMTLGQFEAILNKLPLVAHIHLEGLGEPFLHKDFAKMVTLAIKRGVSVDTTTNCTVMTERLARELAQSGLMRVFISVDGATAETYEKVRVGASFEKTVRNLRMLTGANALAGNPMELSLWFVGMKGNIRELPHLLEIASELGVPMVYADATHDWGKATVKDRVQSGGLQNFQDLAETCMEFAQIRAKELGISLIINPLLARIVNDKTKTERCRWPWWSFYITVEGYVMPCCLRPDPRVLHFGNLLESDFNTIWNSPEYAKFRSNLKYGVMLDYCKGCMFWC